MALPVYVELGGFRYKLSVPYGISGAVYSSDEVFVPRTLVDILDIKYDLDTSTKPSQATIPPVFTEQDVPKLDIYPGDAPKILDIQEAKNLLLDFLRFRELLTGDKSWKTLNGRELIGEAAKAADMCMESDMFSEEVPSLGFFTDLVLSAGSKDYLTNVLPLISDLKSALFNSLDTSDAVIFESTVLLVYLAVLQKISGPAFVYDYIFGGIQPELKKLLSHKGIASLTVAIGGSTTELRTGDDAAELLERFEVRVDEAGSVFVRVVDDIRFISAKVVIDTDTILTIDEDVSIKAGLTLPYTAKVVNDTEVAVIPTLPNTGVLTALTESNVVFDDKKIGMVTRNGKDVPIYATLVKPADYRGFSKLHAVVPSIVTIGKYRLTPERVSTTPRTKVEAREDLLKLLHADKKTLRASQDILENSARLLDKTILSMSNIDSIFSPEHREFVREYLDENKFVFAPPGYALSAQLASVLKLNNINVHGRLLSNIPEYRQIANAVWNGINGLAINAGLLETALGDVYVSQESTELLAVSLMAYKVIALLTGKKALRAAAPQELVDTYQDKLPEAAIINNKIVSVYPLRGFDGVLVFNVPGSEFFDKSRGGLILLDTGQATKIVIPLIVSVTETEVPQPLDGIQYIDGFVDILKGAVADDFIIYPSILISGHGQSNISLAQHADEQQAVYLMKQSLERELVEADPHIHQNAVLLNIMGRWVQAIGNAFIQKCRCKL